MHDGIAPERERTGILPAKFDNRERLRRGAIWIAHLGNKGHVALDEAGRDWAGSGENTDSIRKGA